ncbi:MAG: hypothetical protein K2Q32_09090, partial [Alphaproteobacteria bacterium]|nr:hypothetical protein [Alphaproteobacteria bacterium]
MKKTLLLNVSALAFSCLIGAPAFAVVPTKAAKPSKEVEVQAYENGDYKVKLGTGFDYSVGNYGQTMDTEIWYVPVSAKVERGSWTAKLTIPWLSISGPSAVLGGGGDGTVVRTAGIVRTTESGLGDMVAALTYGMDLPQETFLDLTGKVKIPTGDFNKGLGTGEADYSLLADVTKMFGPLSVFGGVGYKFVGTNSVLNLKDSVMLNAGAGYDVTPQLNAGATYDWRLSASRRANPSEGALYMNY